MASGLADMTPQQYAVLEAENHDAEILSVVIVFTILAVLATLLRVTSRHMKKVAVGADDVLIVVGLVITVAESIYIAVGVRSYGLGRHLVTLAGTPERLEQFQKLWYSVGLLQPTLLMVTKLSVLGLYHRIFVQRTFRILTWVLGVIVVLWWVGAFFADVFLCVPAEHLWRPDVPAHCGNRHLLGILEPIPWIATDLAILVMPLPFVWQLQLPAMQRVGLGGLFLLGGFALVSSCVRYSTLFFTYDDLTWEITPAAIWTVIEANVTIIAACLIVSRPWFLKVNPKRLVPAIRERLLSRSKWGREKGSESSRGHGRLHLLSSFARIPESPPNITTGSMGTAFAVDLEQGKSDALTACSDQRSERLGLTSLEAVYVAR
ncbi:MAG: hypothetical protein Q9173_004755 [Seirophora scorigena]